MKSKTRFCYHLFYSRYKVAVSRSTQLSRYRAFVRPVSDEYYLFIFLSSHYHRSAVPLVLRCSAGLFMLSGNVGISEPYRAPEVAGCHLHHPAYPSRAEGDGLVILRGDVRGGAEKFLHSDRRAAAGM